MYIPKLYNYNFIIQLISMRKIITIRGFEEIKRLWLVSVCEPKSKNSNRKCHNKQTNKQTNVFLKNVLFEMLFVILGSKLKNNA